MKRKMIVALVISVIILWGIPMILAEEKQERPAETDVNVLVSGNNEFALELHRRLANKGNANVVVSPFSISTAMAIVHVGARGKTGTEMAKAMRFTLPSGKQVEAFKDLLSANQNRKGAGEFVVANALWGEKQFPLRENFLTQGRDYFKAELRLLDFRSDPEGGRTEINRWVEEKTRNKVRELIQPREVDSQTKLVVTNAVYLKKAWAIRFRKDATKDNSFQIGNEKKLVSTMHGRMEQMYFRGEGVQLLQLPYNDDRLAMLVMLPDEEKGIGDLEKVMDWPKLNRWIQKLQLHDVEISLPRMKIEARTHLPEALQDMGMRLAFTKEADFSGMASGGDLYISDVIHQANIAVDESETEAAAATAIILATPVTARSDVPLPKAVFQADHPFLIFVRDRQTGSILFTARVMDPSQK